jgi:hypothetical protein
MDGRQATTNIGAIHYIVVQQREVMKNLNTKGRSYGSL